MIYSIKRFSIEDNRIILPGNNRPCDPLPKKFTDRPEFFGLKRVISIESTKRYDKNIRTLSEITRKRVKNLRSSLKNGYIYDNGIFPNEETHYIKKYSKPNRYHRMTKDIDNHNRLDYIIYPSEIVEDPETGEKYLVTNVVLQNCVGHFDWKNERSYSKTNEGND